MVLQVKRIKNTEDGIFGVLYMPGFCCYTLELPYKDNEPWVSSIPTGLYSLSHYNSEAHPDTFKLKELGEAEVNGRTDILIHIGNTIDDSSGCILVGYWYDRLDGKRAVLNSAAAMNDLRALLKGKDNISICIEEVYDD